MSIKSKMTAIADKIRSLLGISEVMDLDGMADNLVTCQSQVNTQAELLDQALLLIEDKASAETIVITPVLQDKIITPSSSDQIVLPDVDYDALSSVSVSGDPDLVSENIKSGVNIFGVVGEYSGEPIPEYPDPILQSKYVVPTEQKQIIEPDRGYDYLSSVEIQAIDAQYVGSGVVRQDSATYTPGRTDQVITAGKYLDGEQIILGDNDLVSENIKEGINLFGVVGTYVGDQAGFDMSDATATEDDILLGKTAYTKDGLVTGTIFEVTGSVALPMTETSYWSSGTEYFEMASSGLGARLVVGEDTEIGVYMDASKLGDATISDVKSGKTFTSKNGISLTGTYAPPAGLPNGVSKLASGTFKLSSDTVSYNISHGLGVVPNFAIVVATGDIVDSSFKNYVYYHSCFHFPVNMFGKDFYIQMLSVAGYSDGVGSNSYYSLSGQVSYYFSTSRVHLELTNDSIKFKSGVTYRWICGLVDY